MPSAPINSTPPGGCIPPAVQACSFELDVQWILDVIDKISEFLRNVGKAINTTFDIIGEVLAALSTIADWFAWVPGVGKMAKDAIKAACDIAGDAVEFCYNLEADLLQFCKNALAPWEIRSAGRQINSQIVPQAQHFTEALQPANFASNQTWKGIAADRFRNNVQKQHDYAVKLQEGTAKFGEVVEQMGDEGVKTTIEFVKNLIKAGIALFKAISKVWAVPVGTAVAAKDVIALVKAILEMIKVWADAIIAVVGQVTQLNSASQNAAPDNKWPAIAR